jgi:hypothetical protein
MKCVGQDLGQQRAYEEVNMSTKVGATFALLGASVLVALLAWFAIPPALARAQCGEIRSSCYTCHSQTDPVNGNAAWHSEFAHRYACWNCHGGNDTTQDQALAHVGLVQNPLADAYTSCYACHPDDYQQRAAQYATLLNMNVSFREPVAQTTAPRASSAEQPIVAPPVSTPAAAANSPEWRQALWLFPLATLFALGWLVWRRRRMQ